MSHDKQSGFMSKGRLTALASAIALTLGTVSLAGCGNDDDDLPPVNEERPTIEEQGSPMQDTTADPGLDQTNTAGGDGSEEPVGSVQQPEGDQFPQEETTPQAEQEPVPQGQQDTMNPDDGGQDPLLQDEDEQGGM
ncbi:hypothetical protein [Halomonas sp. E14]|uniref:hypothetical protein n=1 Tax=Halomonas sp. E14 TaxID=3397245 RepID=UPI00403E9647